MNKQTILSAGVVPVRYSSDQPCFLLLRCYRYWDFPKGEVESDEDPFDAARREVEEETTLTDLDFRWGQRFIETERYGRGKIARYYLAAAPTGDVRLPVSLELGRPEHDEFRWVTVDEADRLVNERIRRVLSWAWRQLGD